MSNISVRRCPICNSIYPPDVTFCPNCGADLIRDSSNPYKTDVSTQSFMTRILAAPTTITEERSIDEPISWKFNGNETVLQKKGKVKYLQSIQLTPLSWKQLLVFKFSFSLILFLSLVKSMFLLSVIGVAILFISKQLSLLVSLSVISLFFLFNAILTFIISKLNISILAKYYTREGINLKCSKTKNKKFASSFLTSILTYILCTIVALLATNGFYSNHSSLSFSTFYYIFPLVGITVALVSTMFEYLRELRLVRDAPIFQDTIDVLQFPEIGKKAILKQFLIEYLFPITFLTALVQPIIRAFSATITGGIPTTVLDIIVLISALVVLGASIFFAGVYRTHTMLDYERLLSAYSIPPPISWIKKENSSEITFSGIQQENTSSVTNFESSKTRRCDFCSAEVMLGLEYCPQCGHKLN